MLRIQRAVLVSALAGTMIAAGCSDDAETRSGSAASAASVATTSAGANTASPTAAAVTTSGSASASGSVSTTASAPAGATASGLLPAPVSPIGPLYDEADVQTAIGALDGIVGDAMAATGVPGIAVAVVYNDEVVFADGWGLRRVGEPDEVDADTVFQVASVSKPVTSTIVAGVVGQGKANWTDPVITWNPDFAFSNPYVTANTTLADLLSHRTGLPGSSGDLLEDLGWDRDSILGVLDQQPLQPFRTTYDYSNFGITEGGVAAADAMGTTWEQLAGDMLFSPLAMSSSSYRHADFLARQNKAVIHVPVGPAADKQWAPTYADVRNADAEAPAGGLSSSVNDLAQFVRLQLGRGTVGGAEIIDDLALQVTHVPQKDLSQPTTPGARTGFYGLCWNINYDDEGRVRLDHSGAFRLGAATNVMLYETEQLGIVTLTNGQPHGVPEAVNNAFFDVATHGQPTIDWINYFGATWDGLYQALDQAGAQWATPPANAAPAPDPTSLVGTYRNSYYGPLTVAADAAAGGLSMTMGPPAAPKTFALTAFDGATFTFETIGENATGRSGATFTLGPDGTATSVILAFYDETGLGTFAR